MHSAANKPAFPCIFDWPNGEGYTECSQEYFDTMQAAEAIKPPETNMDDLSPEDYEAWNRLDNRLSEMQAQGGHLRPIRF